MTNLCQDRDARVVVQSSLAHHRASCPSNYHGYFSGRHSLSTVYADSKLANILMAKGLEHHASKLSISMRALVVHPGYLVTNINHDMVDQSYADLGKQRGRSTFASAVAPWQRYRLGAAVSIFCGLASASCCLCAASIRFHRATGFMEL